jgi:hypothetical protein
MFDLDKMVYESSARSHGPESNNRACLCLERLLCIHVLNARSYWNLNNQNRPCSRQFKSCLQDMHEFAKL